MSVVPVEKYDKWRAWLQRVDRLMHQTVRLLPPPDAKKGDIAAKISTDPKKADVPTKTDAPKKPDAPKGPVIKPQNKGAK
jgi:hypothetical protein